MIKQNRKFLGDTEAVSTIVASLMLIIVVAVSAVAISYIANDLGTKTDESLGRGGITDLSMKVGVIGTGNMTPLIDNLVKEYNKEHNGVAAKSTNSTFNLTYGAVLSSLDERMADVGIIDKDQNASSPNLDNYDIYYYEVGAKNMTNVTDSSGIINITRIYVTTNLGSPTLVNTFVDWIRSPRGQQIVNNSGYISHLQEMNGVNP